MTRLFRIHLELADGTPVDIWYGSIVEALTDPVLRRLFGAFVVKASIHTASSNRITAREICTWDELEVQLVANGTTILRGR